MYAFLAGINTDWECSTLPESLVHPHVAGWLPGGVVSIHADHQGLHL